MKKQTICLEIKSPKEDGGKSIFKKDYRARVSAVFSHQELAREKNKLKPILTEIAHLGTDLTKINKLFSVQANQFRALMNNLRECLVVISMTPQNMPLNENISTPSQKDGLQLMRPPFQEQGYIDRLASLRLKINRAKRR